MMHPQRIPARGVVLPEQHSPVNDSLATFLAHSTLEMKEDSR
jgi:hypothetical protein